MGGIYLVVAAIVVHGHGANTRTCNGDQCISKGDMLFQRRQARITQIEAETLEWWNTWNSKKDKIVTPQDNGGNAVVDSSDDTEMTVDSAKEAAFEYSFDLFDRDKS